MGRTLCLEPWQRPARRGFYLIHAEAVAAVLVASRGGLTCSREKGEVSWNDMGEYGKALKRGLFVQGRQTGRRSV
jgi:hypothetical protein